jgi:hypothetical protein
MGTGCDGHGPAELRTLCLEFLLMLRVERSQFAGSGWFPDCLHMTRQPSSLVLSAPCMTSRAICTVTDFPCSFSQWVLNSLNRHISSCTVELGKSTGRLGSRCACVAMLLKFYVYCEFHVSSANFCFLLLSGILWWWAVLWCEWVSWWVSERCEFGVFLEVCEWGSEWWFWLCLFVCDGIG